MSRPRNKQPRDLARQTAPHHPHTGEGRAVASYESQLTMRSGPLPDPETLFQYDQIVNGSAERIIAQMERQAEHRQYLEKLAITSELDRSRAGQRWGGVVAVLAVIGGIYLGTFKDPSAAAAAAAVVGFPVVSMVVAFITGSKTRSEERLQKEQLRS